MLRKNCKVQKLTKKLMACIMTGVLAISAITPMESNAASTITTYLKKAQYVTLKDSNGYNKITVNGKNVSIKKGTKKKAIKCSSGKYIIKTVSRKGTKKTIIVYIDKKKPVIKGVRNMTPYSGKVSIKVTDNLKLDTVTLNGKKKSSSFSVSENGNYVLSAKDKAGNKTTVNFSITKNNSDIILNPDDAPNAPVIIPTAPQITPEIVLNPTVVPTQTPIVEIDNSTANTVCTEHKWVLSQDSSLTYTPTCDKDGLNTYFCSVCSAKKTEDLKSTGHNWELNINNLASLYSEANCEAPAFYYYTCKTCSALSKQVDVYGNAIGHKYEKVITGEEEQIVKKATCTEGTIYKKVCSHEGCKHKYSEETWQESDSLGHDYQEPEVKPEPECSDKEYPCVCSRCNKESLTKKYTVKGKGHSWCNTEKTLASAATCTSNDCYYQSCKNCGIQGTSTWEKPNTKLGHNWINSGNTLVKGATCTANAVYKQTCNKCGIDGSGTWEKANTALGHNYKSNVFAGNTKIIDGVEMPYNCLKTGCTNAIFGNYCERCDQFSTNISSTEAFISSEKGGSGHSYTKETHNHPWEGNTEIKNVGSPIKWYKECSKADLSGLTDSGFITTDCTSYSNKTSDLFAGPLKTDTKAPELKIKINYIPKGKTDVVSKIYSSGTSYDYDTRLNKFNNDTTSELNELKNTTALNTESKLTNISYGGQNRLISYYEMLDSGITSGRITSITVYATDTYMSSNKNELSLTKLIENGGLKDGNSTRAGSLTFKITSTYLDISDDKWSSSIKGTPTYMECKLNLSEIKSQFPYSSDKRTIAFKVVDYGGNATTLKVSFKSNMK